MRIASRQSLHQLAEIDFSFLPPGFPVTRPSGAQHLLDGFGKPVGITHMIF